MRNFYKMLQISSFSSREQIHRAIQSKQTSPEVEVILLDASRRRVYDRAWNCLSVIAPLRANLGLNESKHWKEHHSDFSIPNDGYPSLILQLVEITKEKQKESHLHSAPQNNSNRVEDSGKTFKWLLITILGVAIFLGWMNRPQERQYPESQSLDHNSLPAPMEEASPPSLKKEISFPLPTIEEYRARYPNLHQLSDYELTQTAHDLLAPGMPLKDFAILFGGVSEELPKIDINQQQKEAESGKKPFKEQSLKPLKRPTTGILYQKGKNVAPFSIVTQIGNDYYIKLVNFDNGKTVMSAYIRGGDTLKTKVPVGNYILKYASGTRWYGTKKYFGEDTTFSKADETFSFRRTYDGYEGYTVELILQKYGNLHTTGISRENF